MQLLELADCLRRQPATVRRIITHQRPHLDEGIAIWLLRTFGEKMFPGISSATIRFIGSGAMAADGRTAEDWLLKSGVLYVGVGKGVLDEHPSTTEGRKKDECATTLVAKLLGVECDGALRRIIEYARAEDLTAMQAKGADDKIGLALIYKCWSARWPDDPYYVLALLYDTLDSLYCRNRAAVDAVKTLAWQVDEIARGDSRPLRIASIRSDDPMASKAGFARQGGRADIVIVAKSLGHIALLSRKMQRKDGTQVAMDLRDVVCMIRQAELRARGERVTQKWDELAADGTLAGWYYSQHAGQFLNGSHTATDVEPTKLPLEEVVRMVVTALDENHFPESRAAQCRRGICTHTGQKPCPLYAAGLHRCRVIRLKTRQSNPPYWERAKVPAEEYWAARPRRAQGAKLAV